MSLMTELLSNLPSRRYRHADKHDNRPFPELITDLLSSHGEVSGLNLARQFLDRYKAMDDNQKRQVFAYMADDLEIVVADVDAALRAYRDSPNGQTFSALMRATEPARQEFARRLNQVPGATAQLVSMRADLLRFMKDDPSLAPVNEDFRHLFASWFNRGFLVLRPVNWQSPADILEKIIRYEAVHAIDSYTELRSRLAPEDRRCFAFFHPAMPSEPLIFVEVALADRIPDSIQALLADAREILPQEKANTAVFYSISNCQQGLAGISFGNSLIKQVVELLSRELPQLRTFVTLSPLPGLQKWLIENDLAEAASDADTRRALAARYLLEAKGRGNQPKDPVARFHLFNGALVHDTHANADTSDNGVRQSGGAMVNYLYDLKKINKNHEAFAKDGTVVASRKVRDLASRALPGNSKTGGVGRDDVNRRKAE